MMTLYTYPGTCGFASHAALEYAGADYETYILDFTGGEATSDTYAKVNPKGRVPALVTDHGILTETPAILAYIAQTYPDAGLAPADPFAYARMQSFNSYLCSTVHVAHAHKYRGYRWANEQSSYDDMRAKVPETMSACFAMIEEHMLTMPWVLGDTFSTSDLYLLTISRWLESDEVDVNRFPNVADHMARTLALPAVERVVATESRDRK